MAKKFKKTFKVKIPKGYTQRERKVIGQEIVERIINRSREERLDKNGEKLAPYSKVYAESLEGRIAGKKAGATADLTLTGEMLDSLDVVTTSDGEVTIGYKRGTPKEVLGRAEGNVTGIYGKNKARPRDFMGVQNKEVKEILKELPISELEKLNKRQRARLARQAERIQEEAGSVVTSTEFNLDGEESI